MVYNQERTFAVARLREAARECGVRKKLLKLKSTASESKVAELWEVLKKRRGAGLGVRVGAGGEGGVRNEWGESVPRGHVRLSSPPSDSDRCEVQPDKTDLPLPAHPSGRNMLGARLGPGPRYNGGCAPCPPRHR